MAWIDGVFVRSPDPEMRGLKWGRLFEEHYHKGYDPADMEVRISELRGDPAVHSRKGIYEFLLGGEKQTQLLNVRLFDDRTKRLAYDQQTVAAKAADRSNCPLPALRPPSMLSA